jgi:hypothetical protein
VAHHHIVRGVIALIYNSSPWRREVKKQWRPKKNKPSRFNLKTQRRMVAAAVTSLGADILAAMLSPFDVEALFAMVCSCRTLREKLQPTLRPIVAEGRLARRAQRDVFRHLVAMMEEPRITRIGPGARMVALGPGGVSIITSTTAPVRGRMEYVFAARACFDNIAGGRSSIMRVTPRTDATGIIAVDLAEVGGGRLLGYRRGVVAALVALGYH